jgi:hypothetical protein
MHQVYDTDASLVGGGALVFDGGLWIPVRKIKWRRDAGIAELELQIIVSLMKRLVSKQHLLDTEDNNVILLVDNATDVGALAKGRSKSASLNQLIHVLHLLTVCRHRLWVLHISTKSISETEMVCGNRSCMH